jgi:hypothetical protein
VQNENRPSNYDPNGPPPPPQFRIVHAARISHDGLVYVCDRSNDRIQVFRKDGTFVKEAFVAKKTLGTWTVAHRAASGSSGVGARLSAPRSTSAHWSRPGAT